jgi:hypothetical protein
MKVCHTLSSKPNRGESVVCSMRSAISWFCFPLHVSSCNFLMLQQSMSLPYNDTLSKMLKTDSNCSVHQLVVCLLLYWFPLVFLRRALACCVVSGKIDSNEVVLFGMWHCLVQQKSTDITEEIVASIFRAETVTSILGVLNDYVRS